jgi:hypothetical protein
MGNVGSISGHPQIVAKPVRAVDDRDEIGRGHSVHDVSRKGVFAMKKTTRPFSFANPSFLPAALAAAMLIASSRSASAEPAPAAETERAARVFSATGIRGGVIVHLGATDGKFTAALKANDHCCVQGLTTDPAACDAGRHYIQTSTPTIHIIWPCCGSGSKTR